MGSEEKGSGTNLRNTVRASTSQGMQLIHKCGPTRTAVITRTCVTCVIFHAARTARIATRAGSRGDVVVARLDALLPHLRQQTGTSDRPPPPHQGSAPPKHPPSACLLVFVGLKLCQGAHARSRLWRVPQKRDGGEGGASVSCNGPQDLGRQRVGVRCSLGRVERRRRSRCRGRCAAPAQRQRGHLLCHARQAAFQLACAGAREQSRFARPGQSSARHHNTARTPAVVSSTRTSWRLLETSWCYPRA